MLIDRLNLNQLRVFESVFRNQSMTLAAQELHLTQSGVSQHIKILEETVGIPLFDRIKHKLIPTKEATLLFEKCSSGLNGIENILSEIKGGERVFKGLVSIGMPIEFGNNVIIPLLAQFSKDHPRLRLFIRVGFAAEMNEQLLNGNLDFAFVDTFRLDKRIYSEKIFDERLYLCASKQMIKKLGNYKENKKFFESLDYIAYQPEAPMIYMWFKQNLKRTHLNLNIRANVMDVQGVARFIENGMGVGVLPGHLVSKLLKEGKKIHLFKGSGREVHNAISMAYLKERTMSLGTQALMDYLLVHIQQTKKNNSISSS